MDKKRVTVYDIAKTTGVSASTVTRALNGQKGVGEKMRDAIITKAHEMGYRTNLIAKSLQREKLRIGFIVNERIQGFNDRVLDGAKCADRELVDFNIEGRFAMLPKTTLSNSIRAEISRMADEGVDGIVFLPSTEGNFDEIIAEIAQKDIAVGTVVRKYLHPNVAFSVYPDRKRAGSIAADLFHISGMTPGSEILITIDYSVGVHTDCIEGFNASNALYGFRTEIIRHFDDPDIAYSLVSRYLNENPHLKGIYCTTGMTESICGAIRDMHRSDIRVVGTEITKETGKCYKDGGLMAALFQDPFQQGRNAFRTMYEYLESRKHDSIPDILINPEIVVPGNLHYYEQFIMSQE